MKVKLKTSCFIIGYGPRRKMEIIEVDSKIGKSLIKSKLATLVEENPVKEEVKEEKPKTTKKRKAKQEITEK